MNFIYNFNAQLEELIDILIIGNFPPNIDISIQHFEDDRGNTFRRIKSNSITCTVAFTSKGIHFYEKDLFEERVDSTVISSDA